MAISYLSTNTLKADPYVIPLDLGIMAKVLSVKQGKFDEEAKKVQQGINQLGATDILRPQDKEYLNGKINKLVDDLNGFGGVDLSDANTSNQIESMGGDIYNDKNVINAIAGTRSVRALQEGYKDYKTNPKLSKLYSVANEYGDMQHVNDYLADQNVGAIYGGPSTPTPYAEFKKDLDASIKGTKANYSESLSDNGLFYTKTGVEKITASRVMQEAADALTADQQAQIERDAVYSYRGVSPEAIINKSIGIANFKLTDKLATLKEYQNNLLQSGNDPTAKATYDSLIANTEEEIKALKASSTPDVLIDAYKKDPSSFVKGVYKDETYRGLAEKYAYNKTTNSIIENKAQMFNMRYDQQERFHNDNMEMQALALGLKYSNGKLVPGEGFTYTKSDKTDNDQFQKSEDVLKTSNDALVAQNTQAVGQFLTNYLHNNPDLADVLSSSLSPSGLSVKIKGGDLIENNNGQAGLQFEDFKDLVPGTPAYKRAISAGLSDTQVSAFHTLYDNYNKLATNQPTGNVKLPAGMEEVTQQIQLNNQLLAANKAKIQGVNKQLQSMFGVTDKEIEALDAVKNLDKKDVDAFKQALETEKTGFAPADLVGGLVRRIGNFMFDKYDIKGKSIVGNSAWKYLGDPTNFENYISALNKTKDTNYQSEKDKLYQPISQKPFFTSVVAGSKYFGKGNMEDAKRAVVSNVFAVGAVPSGDGKDFKQNNTIDPVHLSIMGVGPNNRGTYTVDAQVKSPDGKSFQTIEVDLDPTQVGEFGLQQSPYKNINEAVRIMGKTTPMFITAPLNKSIPDRKAPLRASVVVIRDNLGGTDLKSHAWLVNEKGQKIMDIPKTQMATPDGAFAAAKSYVEVCEQMGLDYQTMLEKMIKDSY